VEEHGRQALLRLFKAVRSEAGLTQVDLAQCLGVPQSFVSKYENGERRLDLLEAHRVCRALGVSLRDFSARFEAELAKADQALKHHNSKR
jgi:transcriptional regulator with XRE-family HTH domain